MFNLVNKTFNKMTFTIKISVLFALLLTICSERNNGNGFIVDDELDKITWTDGFGRYRIEGMEPGGITIVVELPGYDPVVVEAQLFEDCILSFSPKLTLKGPLLRMPTPPGSAAWWWMRPRIFPLRA